MLNGTLAYDYTLEHNSSSSHFGFVNNTIGAKYQLFKPAFLDEKPNIYSWKANNSSAGATSPPLSPSMRV